jgi:DNA-binding NarL/FixJ family response regulator
VRRLLATLLSEQEISVVAEAADGEEVLSLVEEHNPDVVVLDLRMRRMDGLDTLRALRDAGDNTPVVVLSAFGTDDAVAQAFRAGAAGFFSKDDEPELMAAQVRLAAQGHRVAGATATDALVRASISASGAMDRDRDAARRRLAVLTERELEIAGWLPRGLSNREIGERVFLAIDTVKTHLSNAMAKLKVSSREEVAVLIDRAGMTADPDES